MSAATGTCLTVDGVTTGIVCLVLVCCFICFSFFLFFLPDIVKPSRCLCKPRWGALFREAKPFTDAAFPVLGHPVFPVTPAAAFDDVWRVFVWEQGWEFHPGVARLGVLPALNANVSQALSSERH